MMKYERENSEMVKIHMLDYLVMKHQCKLYSVHMTAPLMTMMTSVTWYFTTCPVQKVIISHNLAEDDLYRCIMPT